MKHQYYLNFAKIFIIFSLLGFTHAGAIIPDKNTPVVLSLANLSTSVTASTLSVDFQLPSDSKGLYYKLFLAIKFSKNYSSSIDFNTSPTINSCVLYDGETSTTVTAVSTETSLYQSNAVENNVALPTR